MVTTLLSHQLAIELVKDASSALRRAEQARMAERIRRDNAIREARRLGVRYRRLSQLTGLSRMQLDRICTKPDEDPIEIMEKP